MVRGAALACSHLSPSLAHLVHFWPGGIANACAPDLVVVGGHGVDGHLADAAEIGRWRLSEIAAALTQRSGAAVGLS